MRVFDIDQPSRQHFKEAVTEIATLLYIVDQNEKKGQWF
jgi:hypothetical protein